MQNCKWLLDTDRQLHFGDLTGSVLLFPATPDPGISLQSRHNAPGMIFGEVPVS